MSTTHLEVHVLRTVEDADHITLAGFRTVQLETCGGCGTELGQTERGFVQLGVVLDERDTEFYLCFHCLSPLLKPKF